MHYSYYENCKFIIWLWFNLQFKAEIQKISFEIFIFYLFDLFDCFPSASQWLSLHIWKTKSQFHHRFQTWAAAFSLWLGWCVFWWVRLENSSQDSSSPFSNHVGEIHCQSTNQKIRFKLINDDQNWEPKKSQLANNHLTLPGLRV